MAKKKAQTILSVLLVEGLTEVVFYNEIKRLFLKNTIIEHLEGNWNINRKVLDKITYKYSDRPVRVYCCVDRESRSGQVPGLDLIAIKEELTSKKMDSVLSVDVIRATIMLESWFFYDIEGIYKYLKTPKPKRTTKKFKPPEKNNWRVLDRLYKQNGKTRYSKGLKAEGLVKCLDIKGIYNSCEELKNGVDLINKQSDDPTSHLF
ncbi:MAG: DUF4276 family protein [Phycisphaerae bacterium]|nr:DUF4276 family protein [Phycisphaerae bacterium]